MKVATIHVPGSKSLTQRALVAAALAQGNSLIANALIAEDTMYLADALRLLGAQILNDGSDFLISGTAGNIGNSGKEIFLGNNGTALRFLTALVALGHGQYVLTGENRLCERPVGALVGALQSMKIDISCRDNCPPVTVRASGMNGGTVILKNSESSQFVSALLMSAPYAAQDTDIILRGASVSRPYIDLTVSVMHDFGAKIIERGKRRYHVSAGEMYQGRKYSVEADVSSASYFFLAAALLKRPMRVEGILSTSRQGDLRFLKIMEELGCRIHYGSKWLEVSCTEPAAGDFVFDLNEMPDMVPTLAVMAAFRRGKTVIRNVAHLRLKESNRIRVLVCELAKIGITVQETADGLIITGGKPLPAKIETYNDHRIAMSFAVAGRAVPGIEVSDKKCVNKSFPGFWKELAKI